MYKIREKLREEADKKEEKSCFNCYHNTYPPFHTIEPCCWCDAFKSSWMKIPKNECDLQK